MSDPARLRPRGGAIDAACCSATTDVLAPQVVADLPAC
jgi:hypothetical protein